MASGVDKTAGSKMWEKAKDIIEQDEADLIAKKPLPKDAQECLERIKEIFNNIKEPRRAFDAAVSIYNTATDRRMWTSEEEKSSAGETMRRQARALLENCARENLFSRAPIRDCT